MATPTQQATQRPQVQQPARVAAPLVPQGQQAAEVAQPPRQSPIGALLNDPKTRKAIAALVVGDFTDASGEQRRTAVVDRVLRVVSLEVNKPNSRLGECTPQSIVSSVQEAVRLNLEIGGPMGQAYLVPTKGVCELRVGYKGMVVLAMRSGFVRSVQAHIVYKDDRFSYQLGDSPKIEHIPNLESTATEWKFAYCVIELANGGVLRDVMNKATVMKVKARSPSANGKFSPWFSDETEMSRKTVARRCMKWGPMSAELSDLLDRENAIDAEFEEVKDRPTGNAELMGLARAQLAPAPEPQPEEQPVDDHGNESEEDQKAEIIARENEEAANRG